MRRRQFITLIGGAAASWPFAALAQNARKPALIGWLTGAPLSSTTSAGMFLQALQDLGYVKDRDLQITYRSSDDCRSGALRWLSSQDELQVSPRQWVLFASRS